MTDSYRNPFADYNANVMSDDEILDYWCNPFASTSPHHFREEDMFADKMPIVFMGGRGSGKTMFLKYFSFSVQRACALREGCGDSRKDGTTLEAHLRQRGGIGLYLRVDGPVLRSFEGKGVPDEHWDATFTHFLELKIAELYLVVLLDLLALRVLEEGQRLDAFLEEVSQLLGARRKLSNLPDVLGYVRSELAVVDTFRAQVALDDISFRPTRLFLAKQLTGGLWACVRRTLDGVFAALPAVVMIDEYENFQLSQQRLVNTLLKFHTDGLAFRIGMRLEGFHTYDTTSPREFIKPGRDYRAIVFEDVLQGDKEFREFIRAVAKKRLDSVPALHNRGHTDIGSILGEREDLEGEALALVSRRKSDRQHFALAKRARTGKALSEDDIALLSAPDKPLLEMLNVLWVLRGEDPKQVASAMHAYLGKSRTEAAAKYRRDYVDKYKLSLMILLASLYKAHKAYYSFNTFCFLSSGIVGNFIELCRRAFEHAYFEARRDLIERGTISPTFQDRAARQLAFEELQVIPRIHKYGSYLYHLVVNLGNIFHAYHLDYYVTYPETNQFSVDAASIADADVREAFNAAIEWSLVQKKPTLQSTSPGSGRKTIYTLNRIFAPLFDLTYRTRGGHSEEYAAEEVKDLMTKEDVSPKATFRLSEAMPGDGQALLFDEDGGPQ